MLRLDAIGKSFGGRVLFREVDYHFPAGERIAIVGPNGVGKTTLINIMCGQEEADHGEVVCPKGKTVGYLPQEPCLNAFKTVLLECQKAKPVVLELKARLDDLLQKIEKDHSEELLHEYEGVEQQYRQLGGYELESNSAEILMGLGFTLEDLEKHPKELSGGWQMRLELAKLFLMRPDVLVLDEPTNHLDLPSMVWVEKYLQGFQGTLIFISHDRALLNRLSTVTLFINQGKLWAFSGNYDYFMAQWVLLNEQSEKRFENLEKKKAQLQKFVDRFGSKASKAKQAKSKEKMIGKLHEEQTGIDRIVDTKKVHFVFSKPPPSERIILTVKDADVGYGSPLINKLNFALENDKRIAIIGANGIGKSTLLKTLSGQLNLIGGEVSLSSRARLGYFAQDQIAFFDANLNVLENLVEQANISPAEARKILGCFLFSADDVFKPFEVLSGGEKNRLGLARMVALQPNIMMLDEPTNHLDMDSSASLVESLSTYKGAMILVSHDRYVIESLCPEVLVIEKDRHHFEHVYKGMDFDKFFVSREENTEVKAVEKPKKNNRGKAARQAKTKLNKIEKDLANFKDKIAQLDSILNDPKQSYDKLYEASAEKEKLASKIENLEEEWLELSEVL